MSESKEFYEENFALRLAYLRMQKGVSARDMSLSIGQNPGYINSIESGKALPSMSSFFYICEYLGVSPADFFESQFQKPQELRSLISNLLKLDLSQLECISKIVSDLASK
ncbi:MAG: helix-turn-helix transcriptional regulator [Lachnospiraceae bacterium]|nr:helix-turn-helix transcriptional regulator [Lachnospiraceae bacterium]